MAKEFHRSERVSEELQRVLSQAIYGELDDPRMKMVTITDVRVSKDLGSAKVFFSTWDEGQEEAVGDSLERAAGYLRGIVGRQLFLRTVPELRFVYDDSLKRGQQLREAIDRAVASDQHDKDSQGD